MQFIEDLIITVPSLLQLMEWREEAIYMIERCVMICEDCDLKTTLGKLWIIEASLYIQGDRFKDAWACGYKALNMF